MFRQTLIASAIAAATLLSSGSVMAESDAGFIDGASMDLGVYHVLRP